MKLFSITFLLMLFCLPAWGQKKLKIAGYTPDNYEVECAGIAIQGAKQLKIWGYGRKPDLAIIQARRNAVHAMINRGANVGLCKINPLIKKPSFVAQHEPYFEKFFEDGGAYLEFIATSGSDAQEITKVKYRGKKVYKASITVAVRYDALRTRLEHDIKLPSLINGF